MLKKTLKIILLLGCAIVFLAGIVKLFEIFKGWRKPAFKPQPQPQYQPPPPPQYFYDPWSVYHEAQRRKQSAQHMEVQEGPWSLECLVHNPIPKRKKIMNAPVLLMTSGFMLLLAAGGVFGYDLVDDFLAERRARLVLEQLWEDTPVTKPQDAGEVELVVSDPTIAPLFETLFRPEQPEQSDIIGDGAELAEEAPEVEPTPKPKPRPNYAAVGVLSIDKLGLKLPVLSECDDARLKVSVCRYLGDTGKSMVIAGHNYKSHFGKIHSLVPGDEVRFTDLDGTEYLYAVTSLTEVSMDDHWALMRGNSDLTLFTCLTSDRSKRVLVRCLEV